MQPTQLVLSHTTSCDNTGRWLAMIEICLSPIALAWLRAQAGRQGGFDRTVVAAALDMREQELATEQWPW